MSQVVERPKVIALCIPGEYFHNVWMAHMLTLFHHLTGKFLVQTVTAYCSAVYMTRHDIAQAVLLGNPPVDFALWIDDDNILTPEQFDRLYAGLTKSDAQMIAAWTVIAPDAISAPLFVSCGPLKADGTKDSFSFQDMQGPPREIGWTGFPAVLMKTEALRMAGEFPFAPLPMKTERGASGEDFAFCKRLREAGGKILVDPEVAVPHLKLRNVLPNPGVLRAREVSA